MTLKWLPISTAPQFETPEPIEVYAPSFQDLPELICLCRWHPDAGYTIDELRTVTHWRPFHRPGEEPAEYRSQYVHAAPVIRR